MSSEPDKVGKDKIIVPSDEKTPLTDLMTQYPELGLGLSGKIATDQFKALNDSLDASLKRRFKPAFSESMIQSAREAFHFDHLSTLRFIPPEVNLLEQNLHRSRAEHEIELQEEVVALKKKISDLTRSNTKETAKTATLQADYSKLWEKTNLQFLITRVSEIAGEQLLKNETLRDEFLLDKTCKAFVVSIDIRRSTELMLRARTPRLFAQFITELCHEMMRIITNNHGVIDKFTGDGILAFYPEFFSGEDAGYRALTAAAECHKLFDTHYRTHRQAFASVMLDTGLGIGLDYGDVQLVKMPDGLTVVGVPVVYACRLGGANPGQTLVNESAYRQILGRYSADFYIQETSILIKHEGRLCAYEVVKHGNQYNPTEPTWIINDTTLTEPQQEENSTSVQSASHVTST